MGSQTVIFDLGGVVLGWDPVLPFTPVLDVEAARQLISDIDFPAWNRRQDAGRPFAEGEAEVAREWPRYAEAIPAYRQNFDRTLTGAVPGTAAVLAELGGQGVRLLGLTNWSAETFPLAWQRFGILRRLEAIVVSGREGLLKPDPRLYQVLLDRYQVEAGSAVYVDDSLANCEAAAGLGMTAIHFADADELRARLVGLGLLRPRPAISEPLYHVTERGRWAEAVAGGGYPWSGHTDTFEREGFVHLAFRHQVAGVVDRYFARVDLADLVVLELDPSLARPVVAEGAPEAFPHLFAPLTPDLVAGVSPAVQWPPSS